MAVAGAFLVGGATNLLTELIKSLIQITRTAVRCQEECLKLEEVLKSIQPDVEEIERQLMELDYYNPNAKQDLKMVGDWLRKLSEELHLASIKVHKANTASRLVVISIGSYKLSKRITAHNEKITKLAEQRMNVNLHLTNMLAAERSKYPPRELQQRFQEINAILRREEITRLSDRMEGSVHGGYGPAGSPFSVEDLSQHSSRHMNYHPDPQFHRSYTTPYTTPY